MERLEEWIGYAHPDVICLQETKISDKDFPQRAFAELGYEAAHHGDGRWNGVAVVSRVGLRDVSAGFTGDDPSGGECRLVSATCGGVRVMSVYVPNGRSLDSPQYKVKLQWLARLKDEITHTCKPDDDLALCGDFNIAPTDRDVFDAQQLAGATHVSAPERAALRSLCDWGLVDIFRVQHPEPELYSWWDYRGGSFHMHKGMRIDLILLSRSLADRSTFSLVDRQARKGPQPSDHAPVFVDIDAWL